MSLPAEGVRCEGDGCGGLHGNSGGAREAVEFAG